ncbi:hypothetical protein SprV_0200539800 [Sparganum proliferum]
MRTYLTFDGTIYDHVKGTPLGSSISRFIAEAVLQRLESLVFQHHKPKSWARYVDDTFVVIERDQVLKFQEHLNTVFPDIQFTMEEEENNQLAFLDVLIVGLSSDSYELVFTAVSLQRPQTRSPYHLKAQRQRKPNGPT